MFTLRHTNQDILSNTFMHLLHTAFIFYNFIRITNAFSKIRNLLQNKILRKHKQALKKDILAYPVGYL